MNNPFTHNPKAKAKSLKAAAAKVRAAIAALEEAQTSAEHWGDYETIGYFKSQLADFLSSDNGEAGFEPYAKSN